MKMGQIVALIGILLLITMELIVIGNGSAGKMLPIAMGPPEHRLCLPVSYRVGIIHPEYNLSRAEARAQIQQAADFWNDIFGCTILHHDPFGLLTIHYLKPNSQGDTAGLHRARLNMIQIFRKDQDILMEILEHELGHALGLAHTAGGIMNYRVGDCSDPESKLVCPTAADYEEIRRCYWFLWIDDAN